MSWRDDYPPDIKIERGPLHRHYMNGERCRRRWKLITYKDGSQEFFCAGCNVGIHSSAHSMFRELKQAMRKAKYQ